MKLTKKTVPTFIALIVLGALGGSLAWEVLERVAAVAGFPLSLTTPDPLQLFDLYVLSVSVRVNPGTVLGGAAGGVIFGRV
jgi:hypothetical protein